MPTVAVDRPRTRTDVRSGTMSRNRDVAYRRLMLTILSIDVVTLAGDLHSRRQTRDGINALSTMPSPAIFTDGGCICGPTSS